MEAGELPEYLAVIGSKDRVLTAPLKVGAHEDGYVTLSTLEKYSAREEGSSVLDHDSCVFRLSDIVDSDSVVNLKMPFKVLSRTARDKVILDHSDCDHAEFEAFPRATQIDEENDAFDFFVVEDEHNGLKFRLKFSHEAHEDADEVHLKFHSLKVFVPVKSIERVLEDEHPLTLMEMIHTRGFASETYARISAELNGEYDDVPEDQLIGAPFKSARRKIKTKASNVKNKVKSKASGAKNKVKTKFSNSKASVKRRFSAGRSKVSGFGSRARGKINSIRGKKPKVSPGRSPPRIPPKPAYMRPGGAGRSPPRKPLPPTPGQRSGSQSPPRKPLPPIPKNKAKGKPKVMNNNNNRNNNNNKGGKQPKGKQKGNKGGGGGGGNQGGGKGKGGGGDNGGGGSGGGGGGGTGGGEEGFGRNEFAEDAALFGAGAVTGAALAGPGMYPYGAPMYGGYPVQPAPMYGAPPAYPMGGGGYPAAQGGGYPPQGGGYPPQQQQQPQSFGQDLTQPQAQQQFAPNYVPQGPDQGAPQQASYDRYTPAPNFVPEPDQPSPPTSPGPDQQQKIGEEAIEDELTLEDVVSRRKRIVNHVAAVYEKKFGQPPSQQDLDTLRARLDSKVFLTSKAVTEVVVEWIIDVLGGRMA